MVAKTKYEIDEEIWVMYNNQPVKTKIALINIYVSKKLDMEGIKTEIKYLLYERNIGAVEEEKAFRTKEELVNSFR